MRPFEDFQLRNAVFASIWLVLKAPLLVQVYTSDGVSTGAKTWTTMCVLGFGLFYFWAFGTMNTHPRGWGLFPRAMLRWGILLAIALASVPVITTGAVIFAPYLAAVVGFTLPWKKALPIMLATGTVGVIAVWLSAPTDLGWAAFTLFFIPLMLIGVELSANTTNPASSCSTNWNLHSSASASPRTSTTSWAIRSRSST